jgi:hypothetical protein
MVIKDIQNDNRAWNKSLKLSISQANTIHNILQWRGSWRGEGGLTHGITSHNIFMTHKADITIYDIYSLLDKLLTKVMTQNINK